MKIILLVLTLVAKLNIGHPLENQIPDKCTHSFPDELKPVISPDNLVVRFAGRHIYQQKGKKTLYIVDEILDEHFKDDYDREIENFTLYQHQEETRFIIEDLECYSYIPENNEDKILIYRIRDNFGRVSQIKDADTYMLDTSLWKIVIAARILELGKDLLINDGVSFSIFPQTFLLLDNFNLIPVDLRKTYTRNYLARSMMKPEIKKLIDTSLQKQVLKDNFDVEYNRFRRAQVSQLGILILYVFKYRRNDKFIEEFEKECENMHSQKETTIDPRSLVDEMLDRSKMNYKTDVHTFLEDIYHAFDNQITLEESLDKLISSVANELLKNGDLNYTNYVSFNANEYYLSTLEYYQSKLYEIIDSYEDGDSTEEDDGSNWYKYRPRVNSAIRRDRFRKDNTIVNKFYCFFKPKFDSLSEDVKKEYQDMNNERKRHLGLYMKFGITGEDEKVCQRIIIV